jgi:TolB protein
VAVLVFTADAPVGEEVAFLAQMGSYWQVWVMRPDGSGQRQVTRSDYEKSRVAWFPEGRRLLVTSIEGRLFDVDVDTGNEKPMAMSLQSIHDAAVSPDGEWLALAASAGGGRDNHDIWLARPDGKDQRRLVSMPHLQHEPRWSPDGQWIYFLSGDGEQDHDVWRARVSDGSTEQVTVDARYHFELDVSAAGTVAFSSNRTGDYELYSLEPASGKATRWTDSPGMDGHPSWSPDGGSLVFHSTRGGAVNIWRQSSPTGSAHLLTRVDRGARDPEWSRGAR